MKNRVTASPHKWAPIKPNDAGLDAIRAMIPSGSIKGGFAYMAFDGESLDIGSMSEDGDIDNIVFNIRRGQAVDLKKVNAMFRSVSREIPNVRFDHVLYVLSGIRA